MYVIIVASRVQTWRWNVGIHKTLLQVLPCFAYFEWCFGSSACRMITLSLQCRFVCRRQSWQQWCSGRGRLILQVSNSPLLHILGIGSPLCSPLRSLQHSNVHDEEILQTL